MRATLSRRDASLCEERRWNLCLLKSSLISRRLESPTRMLATARTYTSIRDSTSQHGTPGRVQMKRDAELFLANTKNSRHLAVTVNPFLSV